MDQYLNIKAILSAVVFSVIGLLTLSVAFTIFDKFTPGHFWKEILEEDNIALAILVGSVSIAMAMIVSAAIHG